MAALDISAEDLMVDKKKLQEAAANAASNWELTLPSTIAKDARQSSEERLDKQLAKDRTLRYGQLPPKGFSMPVLAFIPRSTTIRSMWCMFRRSAEVSEVS